MYRPHLYGKKFKIVTDHCALCFLLKTKDPQGKLARWALKLQPYDFEIIYKSGKKHLDADTLSRNPVNPAPPSDHETLDFVDLLCTLSKNSEFSNIVELQQKDFIFSDIHKSLCANDAELMPKKYKPEDFCLKNNIVYKINNDEDGRLWRLCIPEKLRRKVITDVHENSLGHLGLFKTWSLIKNRYFWPKMYFHVRRFVNGCLQCQLHNRRTTNTPGPMQLFTPPAFPFHRIGIDFQGLYPITKIRNCYIFVAIDHCTRYIEAWPVVAATSKAAIGVLKKCVIFNHGTPREMLCDRGSSFTAKEFVDFAIQHHIKILYTTAYHPNTNGLCERANGTLKRIIGKYVNEKHKNWDQFVSRATFAMNIATHSVTQKSPYFLLYGREPILSCDLQLPTIPDFVNDDEKDPHSSRAAKGLKEAQIRTINHQKESKKRFDQKHPEVRYNIGDLVLVANFTRTVGKVTKWLHKWYGPFEIVRPLGNVNYICKDLRRSGQKTLRNVSVRHLKPFYNEFYSEYEHNDDKSNHSEFSNDNNEELSDIHSSDEESLAASISYRSRNPESRTLRGTNTLVATDSRISPEPSVSHSLVNPLTNTVSSQINSISESSTLSTSSDSSIDSINCSVNESTVRRSSRSRRLPSRFGDYEFPKSYKTKSRREGKK